MRAASHSQTHNLLCEWIYFTWGSGVESIHDMICRTQAIASNRCRASHGGRALGDDSLRSTKQLLWRRALSMWLDCLNKCCSLFLSSPESFWRRSYNSSESLPVQRDDNWLHVYPTRMQRLFCQRPLALPPEMKHLCEGILSWELCWLRRTKASISHNCLCCGTEVTFVSPQQRHQQTRLTTSLSVPLSTKTFVWQTRFKLSCRNHPTDILK